MEHCGPLLPQDEIRTRLVLEAHRHFTDRMRVAVRIDNETAFHAWRIKKWSAPKASDRP